MSVLGNNLLAQYYAQNQYDPLIRDGLIAYEPFDVKRSKTLIGGFPIDGYPVRTSYNGIRCMRVDDNHVGGKVSVQIAWDDYDIITFTEHVATFGTDYFCFGQWASNGNCVFVSTQNNANSFHIGINGSTMNVRHTSATWTFLCISVNKTLHTTKIFVNSNNVMQKSSLPTGLDYCANVRLGSTGYSCAAGFRVYNRELSVDEMLLLSNEFNK